MKSFAKRRAEFLSVNAGAARIWFCVSKTVLSAQRKLEILNYITIKVKA